MPKTIVIKPLGVSADLPGRSLVVSIKGKPLVTPAAPVSLGKGRYISGRYVDVAEVGIEINKNRMRVLKGLSLEGIKEYLKRSTQKRIETSSIKNTSIRVAIIGFRVYGESIDPRHILIVTRGLGHAIGDLINEGLLDFVCSPFIDGRNVVKIKNEIVTTFYDSVSEVIDYPSVAPLIRLETYDKEDKHLINDVVDFPVFIDNVLCIDFAASNPVAKFALYRDVLNDIVESEEDGELILRYGVNVQYSRAGVKKEKISARDLLGYYFGLDLVGENHRIVGFGSRPPNENKKSKAKILIRKSYGYYNIDTAFKEAKDAIIEEYGKTLTEKMAGILSKENIKAIVSLSRQNFVEEVKGPIARLMSGKGYKHYDSALDYLRSKDIIKWHDNKALKFLTKLAE